MCIIKSTIPARHSRHRTSLSPRNPCIMGNQVTVKEPEWITLVSVLERNCVVCSTAGKQLSKKQPADADRAT